MSVAYFLNAATTFWITILNHNTRRDQHQFGLREDHERVLMFMIK